MNALQARGVKDTIRTICCYWRRELRSTDREAGVELVLSRRPHEAGTRPLN